LNQKKSPSVLTLPPGFQTEEEFKAAQKDPQKMQRFYVEMQQQLLKLPAEQRDAFTKSMLSSLDNQQMELVQAKMLEQMALLPKDQQEAFRHEMHRLTGVTLPSVPAQGASFEEDKNATPHLQMQGPHEAASVKDTNL